MKNMDRLLDIVTGILAGAVIGVLYPLAAYLPLLVLLTVILGIRMLAVK